MQGKLEIYLNDIMSNWQLLNLASNGNAAAVVKANAYGTGAVKVTNALIKAGCKYFYVANLSEGIELRKNIANKEISIAVLEGLFKGNEIVYFKNRLTPVINNLDQLKRLFLFSKQGKKIKSILNIDTGMNRLGLNSTEADFLLKNKIFVKNLEWDFIMSHLANADEPKNNKNYKQLCTFLEFSKNFPEIKLSLANSSGIMLGKKFCLDQTRPGIGLYGMNKSGQSIKVNSKKLKLPIKLFAPIIQIREVGINQEVSYGGIDITKRNSILATIGIGYADGLIRLFKENDAISIEKEKCKIMGNITMDSFVLDITNVNNSLLKESDYLCLLDGNNIPKILKGLNIISYELLTIIGSRIIRNYK